MDKIEAFSGKPLQHLSVDERLSLIDVLWESIEEESLPIPEAHAKELDRRLALYKEGKMEARPWEEVRQEIFGKDAL